MTTAGPELTQRQTLGERLTEGICRRSFSSPEALAYELTIAKALARVVQPAIKPGPVGLTLDVGCGGGWLAHSVAGSSGATVIGLDPSASQVKRFTRARRPESARVGVVRGVAETLPFPDGTFDSVYSSCAWKHWPDPARGVAECVRVTRSGCTLTIVEIDGSSTPDEFRRFADRSRVPMGLRAAYVRFAMRTVVGVAPNAHALAESFTGVDVAPPVVSRLGDMPFNVATTIIR